MIKELTTANEETSKMSAPPIIVNNVNNQATPSQGSNSVQSLASVPTSRNTNSTIERVMTKNAFFTLA
jgi:3-polyprenyl-4-hydroxybenzoate decarboxylase